MSIFRLLSVDLNSDTQEDAIEEETVAARNTTSRMSVDFEEYKHLRNAAPAGKPLPRTLKWVATLPPNVQPTALLRQYARIANVIAATWQHPTSLRSYLDCLFSDNRGNRQGFPPEVLNELIALKRYHDSLKSGRAAD